MEPLVIMLGIAQRTYSRDGSQTPEDLWQTPIAIRALKMASWQSAASTPTTSQFEIDGQGLNDARCRPYSH